MPVEPTELAERYGTPFYLYDLDRVDAAHAALTAALPRPHRLLYSLKANPSAALAGRLADLGCGAEVCSAGELTAALDAGFRPEDVLYTGPAKRPDDLDRAVAAGCAHYSVESPRDAANIRTAATKAGRRVTGIVRINVDRPVPGAPLAFGGTGSQFGTDLSLIRADRGLFRSDEGLRIAGAHVYLAGNLDDEAVLLRTLTAAAEAAHALGELGIPLDVVDLGGGFGAPYARPGAPPDYRALAAGTTAVLDRLFPGWREGAPAVWFESGRYLAGPAGTLVTRVADIKDSHGRRYVLVDSGIHHLGGMAGLRRLPPLHAVPLGHRAAEPVQTVRIVGELCSPLDCWAPAATVPDSLAPGDLLAVPNVGAYGLTASLLGFLSHTAPLEITLRNREVVDVTRTEVLTRSVATHRQAPEEEAVTCSSPWTESTPSASRP